MSLKLYTQQLARTYKEVNSEVEKLRLSGKVIYPTKKEVAACFEGLQFKDVKVVILGQDPYPGEGQSDGLSFSVKPGVPITLSLTNIIKELIDDVGIESPSHGSLKSWTKQGVLLLNKVLTVEEGKSKSHYNLGWEKFSDEVIFILNTYYSNIVFFAWGSESKKALNRIDTDKHLVLSSVHPSPLFADKGFFGCKHFSKANEYLKSVGKEPIDWNIK